MNTKALLNFILEIVGMFSVTFRTEDVEIILFSGSEQIDPIGACGNAISSVSLYLNERILDILLTRVSGGALAE